MALRKAAPIYFGRGQQHQFHNLIAAEEEEWEKSKKSSGERDASGRGHDVEGSGTFEEYREKSKAAGVM